MSFLSYTRGNPYYLPLVDSEVFEEEVHPGSIYSMLTKDFSVFKHVIDTSVLYRDILNNLESKITVVLPPDHSLPEKVKNALLSLDRAEATTLMSYHVIPKAIQWLDGSIYQTRHGEVLLARVGSMLVLPKGESKQRINLLSEGNFFKNGVVYVIDQPIITNSF